MSQRKVLLICYYFPPMGLGGIGRPLNLFRKLPACGWDCHILTVKAVTYRAYEPELIDGLDTDKIHRSGSRDPQRLLHLLGVRKVAAATISKARPVSEKFFPDSKVGWVKPAIRLGRKLHREHNYDVIISTSPPVSSHLVALGLSKELGLPWIADFRDYWTAHKIETSYSDPKQIKRAEEFLRDIRKTATVLTATSGTVADYIGGAQVVTNGYDVDIARSWLKAPSEETFTIGLMGHQHDAREIEPLLKVLTELRDKSRKQFERVRLLQVGQIDKEWFTRLLKDRGLDMKLDLRSRLGRRETIEVLSNAHMFYFGIPEGKGYDVLPGRTFELLASGRPLLVCTGKGSEVARCLAPVDNSCCFEQSDVDTAIKVLREQIDMFENSSYEFSPLSDYSLRFSSEALAVKFAHLMDNFI